MRRLIRLCVFVTACLSAPAQRSQAADEPPDPRFEVYTGVDSDSRSASLNTSVVWGLFWPVNQPGFRFKLDGLASIYGDSGSNILSGTFLAGGVKGLGDILAGYQFNQGPYWFKLYAGAAYQLKAQLVWQAGQIVQDQMWGGAASVEGFWQINERVSASANLSWLRPDNNTSLYGRMTYLVYASGGDFNVAAGGEAGLTVSNANDFEAGKALGIYDDYVRGGPLIDMRYGSHDLVLSGGLSQASDESKWRPYAAIRYGRQF